MKEKIIEYWLWLQPISLALEVLYFLFQDPSYLLSVSNIAGLFFASFFPTIVILLEKDQVKEQDAMTGKKKAMYPSVPKELLFNEPKGFVMGKKGRKYVCHDIIQDGHVFLIGGSGSGKSSCCAIPTLLANPDVAVFAIDIKGELSFKSVKYGSEQVLIVNPQDRSQCGYDPFFDLDNTSTNQKILETMQTITYSLIPLPANVKDPFWKNSARNLLIGLLIYYYKKLRSDFVSIVDQILSQPIEESINTIAERASKKSAEYRYINQFIGMADETLGGIVAEMNNHLVIFANDQDIRYALRDNSLKVDPRKLEEGYSIFLSIREEKLSAYYDVMQLMINQTLAELEKRPEDADPVMVMIDELPRILSAGKIERLLDAARTLRSRKVVLVLIAQSMEALMTAYSENEVTDLISNCSYIEVVSATSVKTQRAVCNWCGTYMARKQSWSGEGRESRVSVSYEEKDIVQPKDLMVLPKSKEAIIITPWGYNRVKKVPYYKDKFLKKKSDEIKKYNESIISSK